MRILNQWFFELDMQNEQAHSFTSGRSIIQGQGRREESDEGAEKGTRIPASGINQDSEHAASLSKHKPRLDTQRHI